MYTTGRFRRQIDVRGGRGPLFRRKVVGICELFYSHHFEPRGVVTVQPRHAGLRTVYPSDHLVLFMDVAYATASWPFP